MNKTFKLEKQSLEVSIGVLAQQADGAVWIKHGNNAVLSTAVASKVPKAFMGFFPLMVEYRERMAASGKFPGGFIKREGRLSDFEVLASRLIDRSIRPLFPQFYLNDVQVLSTVHSSDGSFPNDILALIGSSMALTISSIPFLEPIGAVRIGRIKGEWKFNLSHEEDAQSDVTMKLAGTKNGIVMVEGHAVGITEDELIDVLFLAHENIKEQVDWQLEVQKALKVEKVMPEGSIDWDVWQKRIQEALPKNYEAGLCSGTKKERSLAMDKLRDDLAQNFATELEENEIATSELRFLFDLVLKEALPDFIAKAQKRFDGRVFDEIRQIDVSVGDLACAHGSAVFTRGETQALVSVTLGTSSDVQRMEPLIGELIEKTFMLHYNFPPFSTGEVKIIRGVGRRELGHGYLAESSFYHVLPDQMKFPYTIRAISDILSSNGSSSMATVCGTTMALMDAGVPIKDMISGIAMGLIKDSSGTYHVLSDILGKEDAFGLMDFKITGTKDKITAIQMDIKEKSGLARDILKRALEQAKKGRLFILGEMRKVLTEPREQLSDFAPRITTTKIPTEKIGMVIGPGGKNIKEIIAMTGAEINIEDDGMVKVYSRDSEAAKEAVKWVKVLAGDIEIGSEFEGKIGKHAEYGFFVDIFPGVGGLVHVSTIDRRKQRDLPKTHPVGTSIKVKVVGYDRESGRIRLVAPEVESQRSH